MKRKSINGVPAEYIPGGYRPAYMNPETPILRERSHANGSPVTAREAVTGLLRSWPAAATASAPMAARQSAQAPAQQRLNHIR
jgi:hypothetical protein